jgi:hypothetical protein
MIFGSKRLPTTIFEIPEEFSTDTSGDVLLAVTTKRVSGVQTESQTSNTDKFKDTPIAFGSFDFNMFTKNFLDSKIGEFKFFAGKWILVRVREEKTTSNSMNTIIKTIENLTDVIYIDELFI